MSATIQAALTAAAARLAAAGVPDPARDARVLMADALGVPLAALTPLQRDALPAAPAEVFAGHVAARGGRRPVAQILGRREFWGRSFEVTPDVLDPRPETEALVALALQGPAPARLLDLGLGSGAILVTLLCEWPQARGIGTDLSAAALAVAARNAARHGVADRAEFRRADWAEEPRRSLRPRRLQPALHPGIRSRGTRARSPRLGAATRPDPRPARPRGLRADRGDAAAAARRGRARPLRDRGPAGRSGGGAVSQRGFCCDRAPPRPRRPGPRGLGRGAIPLTRLFCLCFGERRLYDRNIQS